MLENLNDKQKEILENLKTVIDPEVALNIVDLGLIYEINIKEEEKLIHILMTLSSRGCPVGDTIMLHIETVTKSKFKGYDVNVELTWEPEWSPDLISYEGKNALDNE